MLKRFDKLRISRVKSHQIGVTINNIDLRTNAEYEEANQNAGINSSTNSINMDGMPEMKQSEFSHNNSTSDEECLSSFANSRTIIKP